MCSSSIKRLKKKFIFKSALKNKDIKHPTNLNWEL